MTGLVSPPPNDTSAPTHSHIRTSRSFDALVIRDAIILSNFCFSFFAFYENLTPTTFPKIVSGYYWQVRETLIGLTAI